MDVSETGKTIFEIDAWVRGKTLKVTLGEASAPFESLGGSEGAFSLSLRFFFAL
jgi:hypothetical protein